MDEHFDDQIATGWDEKAPLEIIGRPQPGRGEKVVFLEEPGPPVQMHWVWMDKAQRRGNLLPHYRSRCPNCGPLATKPKPMWYVGGMNDSRVRGIIELTYGCYQSALANSQGFAEGGILRLDELIVAASRVPTFRGMLVEIRRGDYAASPRWLRYQSRSRLAEGYTWEKLYPFDTRRELARIWNVPVRPRIFKEA